MSKYSGFHCPVCGSVFTDQDDIVVCPDCGTPHHRECWTRLGHCAYQDRHKENLEWHEDRLIQPGTAQQTACPACGTRNFEAIIHHRDYGAATLLSRPEAIKGHGLVPLHSFEAIVCDR